MENDPSRTEAPFFLVITSCVALLGIFGIYFYQKWSNQQKCTVSKKDVESVLLNKDVNFSIKRIEDVTADITENTVVYPGDPIFERTPVSELGKNSAFNLKKISLGNHTGTHIDFPVHVIKNGKSSSDYSAEDLIMSGLLLELPNTEKSISASFLQKNNLSGYDCVFFKTANSSLSKHQPFNKDYVYIEPDAARYLLSQKIKAVGIDYISVDSVDDEELTVHNLLLGNNVLIIENLELKNSQSGEFKAVISPLKIPDMDGLPARVTLLRN